ncbi:MAG: ssDNA-binding domain-containing protein [Clostridiales bacterium]|nr:ssDNA-binding domain-containing protein [Clostridiales bacterium]
MSDETKQLSKARQALVDRVLSRLDEGAMPWDNGMQGTFAKPYNPISGTRYRGMNVLNLVLAFKQDPRWITFNQAKDNGYTVKKGARGVPIELYKIIDKRTKKDADLAAIKEEIKDMTFEERQAFKKENLQTFAATYHVFNASDVIGIEPYRAPELTPADISARNERIERVIADSQAPIFYDGNGRNFYRPATDEIHLTDRSSFKSDEFFYNTALHEMAHSTGHSSRLNRQGGTFGSKAYAREELVAEMASVLIAAELGLNHSERVIENSAEYVRSWAKDIRDNPQTLIDAAFDASKATDFICDYERQRVQTQEKTQKETLQSSVKKWYVRTFPSDEIASTLSDSVTFDDVRRTILDGKDIYATLGGSADSVVRERVFRGLADVLNVDYGAVYNDWLDNTEMPETHLERARAGNQTEKTQKEKAQPTKQQPAPAATFKTNLDNIPDAMKALPNWVAFRTHLVFDEKKQEYKLKKTMLTPNQPRPVSSSDYLKWADPTDPNTWSTFDKAVALAKKYKLEGLSFAMSGSGMTCVDLDHHLDENGKPSELAQKYISAAQGTYVERSVSGHGLHIFYTGERPSGHQNRNIKLDLEAYDAARFISMTGNLYENAPKEIAPPSVELTNLLKSNLNKLQQYSAPGTPLGMSDNALIEKIRASKRGYEFDALWRGEDVAGDHSVSDFKLCNMLAFFSGGDAAQVERCFRASGLYRPEKGDAYVRRTAEKACTTLSKQIDPRAYAPKSEAKNTKKNNGKPGGNGSGGRGSSGR